MSLLQRRNQSKCTVCFWGEWIIQKRQIVQNCFKKMCVCLCVLENEPTLFNLVSHQLELFYFDIHHNFNEKLVYFFSL